MPNFYNYTENGVVYNFDDVFVPADAFRQGNLLGWGRNTINNSGQLGINDTFNHRSTPVTTFAGGSDWKQVSCGYQHTAAIKTNGTLWVWGRNGYGQLGSVVNLTPSCTPITTFVGGTNWKQVACGRDHTMAIKTDGTLWGWGRGSLGQLGRGDTNNSASPQQPTFGGTNWKQVACGGYHTAAIKTNGTLWTWGYNAYGILGNNIQSFSSTITPITTFAGGTNWKQVACSEYHTAAIKTDGTLWVWGRGLNGRLGNFSTNTSPTPVTTFAGGTDWKQVACGQNHTAAIKTDGTLWIWGLNNPSIQLGTNDLPTRSTPVTTFLGGTNWKQVSCGRNNTVAIKTDGTLWAWGINYAGQVGDNTTTTRSTPVTTFAGGTNWKQVACGYNHVLATTYIDDYQ